MSTRQITVAVVVSPKKAIMHTLEAPSFPVSITDDVGNTYSRHREGGMLANWYTVAPRFQPDRLTMTFATEIRTYDLRD